MRRALFVAMTAVLSACAVSTTNPPAEPAKPVPPGQIRSAEVHERNEERKAEKAQDKAEKKAEKADEKAEKKGDGKP